MAATFGECSFRPQHCQRPPLLASAASRAHGEVESGERELGPIVSRPSRIFIERSAERCSHLDGLKSAFPDRADRIDVQQGDANEQIRALCAKNKDWSSHRAVLFLDPYGMQVEWTTIEAIAATRAIDLWVLFPLGIGVNRLLTRSGDIPESWRQRLNLLLGTEDWYDEFYKVETVPTLFGTEQQHVVKAKMETIGRCFNNRLKSIFAEVVEEPGVLRNSANNPLYLLCFAVGNVRAKKIALPIARHLLKELNAPIDWRC